MKIRNVESEQYERYWDEGQKKEYEWFKKGWYKRFYRKKFIRNYLKQHFNF